MQTQRVDQRPATAIPGFATVQPHLRKRTLVGALVLGLVAVGPTVAQVTPDTDTCTWNTAESGNWSSWNWSAPCGTTYPGSSSATGFNAVVTNGAVVTLDVSGIDAGALTIGDPVAGWSSVKAFGPTATDEKFSAITLNYGSFIMGNGASVTTSGNILVNDVSSLQVGGYQSGGGDATLTVGGNLINNSTSGLGIYVDGIGSPTLVTVAGSFTNTSGSYVVLMAGGLEGQSAEIRVGGAAPSKLTGTYQLDGHTGGAELRYGSAQINQIGDGAGNTGWLILEGNASIDTGSGSHNSALSGLALIARESGLEVEDGGSFMTSGGLALNGGYLMVDSSHEAGGSVVTVAGDLVMSASLDPWTYPSLVIVGNTGMRTSSLLHVGGLSNDETSPISITGGNIGAAATLEVDGSLDNSGDIYIGSYGNLLAGVNPSPEYVRASGATAFDANGELSFGHHGSPSELRQGRSAPLNDIPHEIPSQLTNEASGTITIAGGFISAPGFTNAGTLSGFGTVASSIGNAGSIVAGGGTLIVQGGIQGNGGVTISSGGTLDVSQATTGSSAGTLTLSPGGLLILGSQNLTVFNDYVNFNFGTGNSFNKFANITGTGRIVVGNGNVAEAITGSEVSNGTTPSPTLAFGNVHVGSSNDQRFAIANTGTSGPALRGAIQTSVNGGNVTDASLSGSGVTAANWGPVSTGATTAAYTVTYTPAVAGPLSGQAVHIANSFANVAEQTLAITGSAYDYANPTASSSLAGYDFGVVQVGQTYTDQLTIRNVVVSNAAYQEGLNASFGAISNAQLTGVGSITNLAAGQNSNGMVVNLTPTEAGAVGGTVTINFASNGATTSGLGITTLDPQTLGYTWQFTGTVVNQANPSITPQPVAFGNVRIGSTQNQALAVENVAGTPPQASLNAQIGPISGAATSNNLSSINQLAAGSVDGTSFVVGLDTATAGVRTGSVQINLQSDSVPNGCTSNCIVNLPADAVNVSGTVYRLANPTLGTSSLALAARVGDASPTADISVTNTSPDQYTEGLTASLGGPPVGFTSNGSITNLAAQGTDGSSLHVGLDTSTTGTFTGSQAVNFVSNGQIDNAMPISVGSQNVALAGNVYTPAQAEVITTGPIDFGIVHVGDGGGTLSQSISVGNGAVVTALNDTLRGSIATTGAAFTGTGSLGTTGLAAGDTSSAMGVDLSTATAGVYSGTADLSFASHDSQLADLALAGTSLGLDAQVNNYAELAFSFGSGLGTLTCNMAGTSCTLDLGHVQQGTGATTTLLAFNNVGGPAAYTDLLSSTGSITSGSGFSLTGDSVTGLAGGGSQGGFEIGLDTAFTGTYNEWLSFSVWSSNASGYNQDIGSVGLHLTGLVTSGGVSVPEPDSLVMFLLGLGMLGLLGGAGWRRRMSAANDEQ